MARRRRRKWILAVILFAIVGAILVARRSAPRVDPGSYLDVDLQGSFAEGAPSGIVGRLLEERKAFVDLLDNLAKARRDSRIAGVIVRIGHLDVGWSRAREIRDALAAVQASGKQVVAHVDSELFGANKEYYVASAAERIALTPASVFTLNGLSAHYYFLGGLWQHLGVTMEVEQIREYKTFGDMLGRRAMSPAHREMANSILDDINAELTAAIAEDRGLSSNEVSDVIDACPSSPGEFVESGLADEVVFFDELRRELGGGSPVPVVRESEYQRVSARSLGMHRGPKIAVVNIAGTIVGGAGGKRSVLGMTVGSRVLSEALDDAADDEELRAIVVRIDSPGGSARAADEIWHAMRRAASKKPVVASLGDLAASGGYYIAAGADRIVAEPGTLTGSIGVVLFKPNVSALLERLDIGTAALQRGRYARLMDIDKPFDDDERALLRSQMNGIYHRFLDRVAQSRNKTAEEIDRLGGGRVWTGRQALSAGLIDALGGLGDAVRLAASEAGIADTESASIRYLPGRASWIQRLLNLRSGIMLEQLPPRLRTFGDLIFGYATLPPGIAALPPAIVSVE